MRLTATAPSSSSSSFDLTEPQAPSLLTEESQRSQSELWNLRRAGETASDETLLSAEFPGDSDATAAARAAQRELVQKIGAPERALLYSEHGSLVDKSFTVGLSSKEEARLQYVRWALDRIEEATVGEDLDTLESLADLNEALAEQVSEFVEAAKRVASPPRRNPSRTGR